MKAMEQHTNGNIWAAAGGALLSIGNYLLHIDWQLFLEQLTPEIIKVALLGVIGGACGLLGKKIVDKLFFKRKRK